jgi:hypothetical protein
MPHHLSNNQKQIRSIGLEIPSALDRKGGETKA